MAICVCQILCKKLNTRNNVCFGLTIKNHFTLWTHYYVFTIFQLLIIKLECSHCETIQETYFIKPSAATLSEYAKHHIIHGHN